MGFPPIVSYLLATCQDKFFGFFWGVACSIFHASLPNQLKTNCDLISRKVLTIRGGRGKL